MFLKRFCKPSNRQYDQEPGTSQRFDEEDIDFLSQEEGKKKGIRNSKKNKELNQEDNSPNIKSGVALF